jgi:hypothetical protein
MEQGMELVGFLLMAVGAIFVLYLAIMTIMLPLFVGRIRNEIIYTNELLKYMIEALKPDVKNGESVFSMDKD